MPAHTPIQLLKAGGNAFFSAACIALLSQLGYNMEEFGTHESVLNYLRRCRQRRREGRTRSTGRTAREHQLGAPWFVPGSDPPRRNPASFESGHLMMNGTQQGRRGDACSNLTDGHDDSLYPCMPHQGPAGIQGTVHNENTAMEYNQAGANGAQPNGNYANASSSQAAHAQCQQDCQSRIDHVVGRRRDELGQPQGQAANQGSDANDPNPNGAAAAGAAGSAAPGSGAMPGTNADGKVDGNTAEECIENFRKFGEAAMKQHASSDETIAANQAAAGSATPADYPAARDRLDAAEQRIRDRRARGETPSQADYQERARARRAVERCNAACRAEQGRRIQQSPPGREGARCPSGAQRVPGTPQHTAGQQSQSTD